MQAQLQCEHCGKTPDQTEFSTKMLHRFPLSRAKAVQFELVHLYLHAVPQPSNPRWRDFVANGYRHSGHRTRRWLCRAHTPDVQNPFPTQCANFVLTGCPNKVTSASQLKKRVGNRFCESCKDRRAATLRLQLGQVPSFNVI